MKRRSTCLRLMLALWAVFLALSWAPAAGAAVEVPIDNCNAQTLDSSGWIEFGVSFQLTDSCASGGGLQIGNASTATGDEAGWRFDFDGLSVVSYSFDIDGGDTSNGVDYGVRGCDLCADDYAIGDRDAGSPTEHVEVLAPTSDEAVIVYAKCTDATECAETTGVLRISNLSVTVTDLVAPDVGGTVPDYPENVDSFRGWTNQSHLPVTLYAFDAGFGIFTGEVRIGGSGPPSASWNFEDQCPSSFPLVSPTMCPFSVDSAGSADIEGLLDGIHQIQFSATDAAGNSASTSAGRIGVDRTAPDAPQSTFLTYTPSGWPGQRWTSNPDVALTWDPAPELLDPDFESPIVSQSLSVRRLGSGTVLHPGAPLGVESVETTLIADGEWNFDVNFNDQAGNVGAAATRSVGLDVDAPNPPLDLIADGWYSEADFATRPRLHWTEPEENPALESGVCGYVVRIDGSPGANPVFGQDDATIGTSWPLPAGLPQGESFAHLRAVSCAGVASATVTTAIHIDTVAPQIALSGLADPDEWSGTVQQGDLTATDEASGVEAVGFAIDEDATTWVSDNHLGLDIPEGSHELTVSARDVAGNVSTFTRSVKTDTTAPEVDLGSTTLADPTLANATVRDRDSGLALASIELRRVDQGASAQERGWQTVGGPEPIVRGTTDAVAVARRIDDAQLDAGDYELRVNAADVAGNSAVSGSFAIRAMRLPLRRPAELSFGIADVVRVCRTRAGKPCPKSRKCAAKLKCKTVTKIDVDGAKSSVVRTWSGKSALVGDALDASGAPLAGVNVAVSAAAPFHDSESFGSVVTDAAGHFEKLLPRGPSREFTVRIEGGPTQQPASATATRNVRSDIEFEPNPTVARAGHSQMLAGRVLHAEWLPVGGVAVSFEWYSPNGWATFGKTVRTDARGRFKLSYPWSASAKRSTVKLRARVDRPIGWPFAPGSSDSVRVEVLPKR